MYERPLNNGVNTVGFPPICSGEGNLLGIVVCGFKFIILK